MLEICDDLFLEFELAATCNEAVVNHRDVLLDKNSLTLGVSRKY